MIPFRPLLLPPERSSSSSHLEPGIQPDRCSNRQLQRRPSPTKRKGMPAMPKGLCCAANFPQGGRASLPRREMATVATLHLNARDKGWVQSGVAHGLILITGRSYLLSERRIPIGTASETVK